MARLSTHVLDTANGKPASGVHVLLYRLDGGYSDTLVTERVTNRDGRTDEPLLSGSEIEAGHYRLVFHAGDYFRECGIALPDPPFVDVVELRFGIADANGDYHVPLLVSPWSYSTYRGS
jgi:5-hydroxyisourate hydrolase